MPVGGLHSVQELPVVAAVDGHRGVVLDQLHEHGEWPRVNLLLLPRLQLLARGSDGPPWQEGLPQLGSEAVALYFQMLL